MLSLYLPEAGAITNGRNPAQWQPSVDTQARALISRRQARFNTAIVKLVSKPVALNGLPELPGHHARGGTYKLAKYLDFP